MKVRDRELDKYFQVGPKRRVYSSLAQSVEHAAVNRVVVGSSPTRGVSVFTKKLYSRVLRDRDAYHLLEIADTGPLVKRLRHRPFTAVTRVQIPLESYMAT